MDVEQSSLELNGRYDRALWGGDPNNRLAERRSTPARAQTRCQSHSLMFWSFRRGFNVLTKPYVAGQETASIAAQLRARVIMKRTRTKRWRVEMSKKLIATAILATVAFGAVAPGIAMAKGAPKTKAACEKISTMKWDDASAKCVKK